MNITQALARTPVCWTLTNGETPSKRTGMLVPVMLLTVTPEPGAEPVTMHFNYGLAPTIENMLAEYFKKHDRDNPVWQTWRSSRGEVIAVELEPGVLECLGEAMHRGLRKLADSKQSVITWNALHYVHAQDRIAVWSAARQALDTAFATKEPVTRRELAQTLRDAVIEALDSADSARSGNGGRGDEASRSSEQQFALRTLRAGCEMTDIDEWMWSWLGYVVKDVVIASAPVELA